MDRITHWNAGWMEEDHIIFQDAIRGFFAKRMIPDLVKWREAGVVERQFWVDAGVAGLLGASVPEAYGGAGGDHSFDAIIAYQTGLEGDVSWGWVVHNYCTHYILAFGTEEQKHRWVPKLVTGEIVAAIAMTEPGTGSDLQAVTTTAVKDHDSYVLNGSKTFISNGQSADIVITVAKTDPAARAKGISLIVVEVDKAEGFRRGRNLRKLGRDGQDTSELFYENVRVPQENLLGGVEGQGFRQLMSQLAWERLSIGVEAMGASDFILNQTLEYVRQRKAFGQRLMDFQNTRFKLAEAKTKAEVTRAFLNQCVGRMMGDELDAAAASMAKWWATQIHCEIADECLQLFGGWGYMWEHPISRAYADARVEKIIGGTNEIMKELIARSLDS